MTSFFTISICALTPDLVSENDLKGKSFHRLTKGPFPFFTLEIEMDSFVRTCNLRLNA
jgi:hypothetical protein